MVSVRIIWAKVSPFCIEITSLFWNYLLLGILLFEIFSTLWKCQLLLVQKNDVTLTALMLVDKVTVKIENYLHLFRLFSSKLLIYFKLVVLCTKPSCCPFFFCIPCLKFHETLRMLNLIPVFYLFWYLHFLTSFQGTIKRFQPGSMDLMLIT